jgi:hypothetical protein
MKTFLQYITEEPVLDYHDDTYYQESPAGTARMGKIGPYEIRHRYKSGYGIVHIMHNGESVGHVPYGTHRGHIIPHGPSLHPDHRGKKSLVKGLMSRTYMMLADKTGKTIRSDDAQTKGGRHIWRQLAAKKRVEFSDEGLHRDKMVASLIAGREPRIPRQPYDPEQHEKRAYGKRTGFMVQLYLKPRKPKTKK